MRATIALFPVLLILAACGDAATAPPTGQPDGEPAATLDGRTFIGDQVTGHQLVAGSTLWLQFKDGKLSANAGCNHLGGTGRLDNGVLVGGIDVMTEMGCDPQLMDQDTWFSDFLGSSPSATVTAESLVLSKDGTSITFADEAHVQAQNPIPLEGTTWELESILSDGGSSDGTASSVPGPVPSLRFTADGRYEVFTGCNQGSGNVTEATSNTLVLSAPAITKMACKNSAEAEVLAVLDGSALTYVQDYDILTLTHADGSGLQYRAAS